MSAFEFFLSFYGLLLGFSLVEVLGGLARTVEARLRPGTDFRIGWLTPLLGVFVLLDLVSFWGAAWTVRDFLTIDWPTLVFSLGFTGAYYLAAHLVFPHAPEEIPDLDAHYFRVRRIVLGVLLALLVFQLGYYATIPQLATVLARPQTWILTGMLVALMIAAMCVRGTRISALLLAAMSIRYLAGFFA
jgi:hypothetical protein